ncbi:unnamed protein product [Notodromas monacha]|uniref:Uncharacterized protein n=1 Tax=Notodromas monacha TaxID=399045 RepID=A0A7R9BUI3_9CRUS|nr:unnamed protein product [Notodromas monacha]CAG0920438.1 unnamed protein product [Notodromas monacha]
MLLLSMFIGRTRLIKPTKIASVSIVPIPVQAVIAVCNAKGNTWKEKLRESLKSKITYCPTCGSDLLCKTGRMRIHNANADEETDSALRSNPSRKLRLKMKKLRTSKSARNAAAHSCVPDKNVGAQILGPASPKATTEDVKIQNNLEMNELNSGASQNS